MSARFVVCCCALCVVRCVVLLASSQRTKRVRCRSESIDCARQSKRARAALIEPEISKQARARRSPSDAGPLCFESRPSCGRGRFCGCGLERPRPPVAYGSRGKSWPARRIDHGRNSIKPAAECCATQLIATLVGARWTLGERTKSIKCDFWQRFTSGADCALSCKFAATSTFVGGAQSPADARLRAANR